MAQWSFVGRAGDLRRLLTVATGDDTGGLILSGTAGIGKSRLLRECMTVLPDDRYALHSAAANIANSGLPFGGLAQVLPPDPPAGLSPAGLLRWAADSLHAAAEGRPMVLAVDDAHLLDPPSAALVHLLVRENATLLGTLRSAEPVPPPISALWTEGIVEHAELAPLTAAESGELLTRMLGGPVEAISAQRLTQLAAGNALLLRELVEAVSSGGEITTSYGLWCWTGRLTLAPSLADLIDSRIGRLEAGVRDVVELVAFGEPIGLDLLIRAAAPRDVETAEERGLIQVSSGGNRRDVRLAHPLYGEVVRRRCGVIRSRRLQATLADVVQRAGARRRDDLLRVAVWRLDSDTAQDSAMLLDAAAQAADRFDLPLAIRLATAAVETGGGHAAAELLVTVLLFADQAERALDVLDAAAAEFTTAYLQSRRLTMRTVLMFWGLGRPEAIDELSDAAARMDDPAAVARMRAFESLMRLQLKDVARGEALARQVLDEPAAPVPAKAMVRCVLAFLAAARGRITDSSALLAAVDADTAQWRRDSPLLQYALEMARGTRVSVALDLPGIDEIVATEFADLAQAGGFGFGSAYVALLRAHAAWLRGRTDEALRSTEQACVALASSPLHDGGAHASRASVAALRGDVELAVASMAVADRAPGNCLALFSAWRDKGRAWTTAASGDLDTAVRQVQELAGRLRADGFIAHELLTLYDLVRFGRADLAVDRMTVIAPSVDSRASALLLRHARAAADNDGAELFAVARDFAARTCNVFAAEAAAQAVGLFRAARNPLGLAASTLLADVLARCDALRTPALIAVQPSLTSRERQVAQLAADGVSSKKIADRLFLSPRTVENHLQRVYAKLGVTGRVELAPALRSLPSAIEQPRRLSR